MYHDLLYDLGFTEVAGNFETNNNDKGGKGNDAVILNAQDAAGTDNADFATPVDGQQPRMRMFIWDYSTPERDCAFDAGVIIHEYTHGLSNRLTGGPANVACLNVLEAGGMGEGWGDFMAIAIHVKTTDTRTTDYPLGDWIYNNPAGIRDYLYSTSLSTNPLTYASTNSLNEVHAIGTLWATILYEVLWNLADVYGLTATRKPVFNGKTPTDGRFLAMKLVVDGLAL
jgi:extracellular elastinolytic metalloproteinase